MTNPKVAEFAAALERAADVCDRQAHLDGYPGRPLVALTHDAATLRAWREALLEGQEAYCENGGLIMANRLERPDDGPVLVITLPAESKEKP